MLVRRFPAVRVASSCCGALGFFHRPRILTEPGVLPTTACDMKASVGRFDATVPQQAAVSVATAASPACRKGEAQPPSPATAGDSPTNHRQPCNLTRPELDELLERNYGTPLYSLCFFNVASRKGDWEKRKSQYNLSDDDDMERCSDCGMTIDEHCASTSSATADEIKREIKRVVAHFVMCVNSGKHKEALDHYRNWMMNVSRSVEGEYCAPMKVKQSWGGDIWKERLIEARKGLVGLDKNERDPRAPRVLGIHAGTGSGKTHALLDAAQHLKATTAIYITYDMGQGLKLDHTKPSIASLLRILLRHPSNGNLSNLSCDEAFACCRTVLSRFAEERLLDFVVSYIAEKEKGQNARAPHVVIAVDEIRKLMVTSDAPVLAVTSTLGLLASKLEGNGVKCTVIISALTESAFVTENDRLIVKVRLPQPSDEARAFIVKQLFGKRKPTEQQVAMLVAACGTHFRSIVIGCQALLHNCSLDVWTLVDKIRERTEQNMDESERVAIRDYTQRCVSVGSEGAQTPVVAPFLDNLGSLAPPIVCIAFKKDVGMPEFRHPAEKLLEATTFISAPRQLLHCGYHYDRFRALYGLPVVPYGVEVCNGGTLGAEWFKELTFPMEIAFKKGDDTSSLFAEKGSRVVRTKHKLEFGKYFFPNPVNHPYGFPDMDRTSTEPALAVHCRDNTMCLVLYRDEIDGDEMPAVVDGLNTAASALQKEMKIPVLCVAQVIGASLNTTSQNDFKHPYILIRDDEVPQFYTPTFAAALRFVQQRHALRHLFR